MTEQRQRAVPMKKFSPSSMKNLTPTTLPLSLLRRGTGVRLLYLFMGTSSAVCLLPSLY
jgi:hypothetical protein